MDLNQANVLVVDDEPYLRAMSARWLTEAGCQRVLTARDGEAALALIQAEPIDLLLTDVRMPRVDGMELVRKLAETGKTIPSAFLSGFGAYDPREMYALGVESILPKPVEESDLVAAASTSLAARSTLWTHSMPIAPTQSVLLHATHLAGEASPDALCLGRGGFTAHCDQPLRLGKVSFRCLLADRHPEFAGQGYIRWISSEEQKIGIEFRYLEEPCHALITATIDSTNPDSFIPGR